MLNIYNVYIQLGLKMDETKRGELILITQEIESMKRVSDDFYNDLSALPCFTKLKDIHLKLPGVLVFLLKEIAKKQNDDFENLIKKWLNEKLKEYNMLIKHSESKIEKVYEDKEDAYKDLETEEEEKIDEEEEK